jgi:hypothetical protein
MIFQLVSIFKKLVKPSWKLRGELHSGEFCLVKGKAFETGGEISNLKNASCNLIYIPMTICKRLWKEFPKRICKNKTCGANVVQNIE